MKMNQLEPLNSVRGPDVLLEELEDRLEAVSCVEIDVCFGEYCWQFSSTYGCESECMVQCHPFRGCDPYCY